ncbi:MAG: DNA-binding protein [Pseudomonas sp. PGPPP3]|nr:MAG: DNA-binding protein [Pseudomonas sp. PGPPP3]
MPRSLRLLVPAVAALLLLLAIFLMRWDARALLWLQEAQTTPAQQATQVWLPGYRAVLAREVPGFEKEEFSGLSYNSATDTLFTVSGKQPQLVELSLTGQVLRSIPIKGAANLEGVAVLADGHVAVIDERQRSLSIFLLNADTRELDSAQAVQRVELGTVGDSNKGFEGLAWDPRNQRLLLANEKNPVRLFSLACDGRRVSGPLQALGDLDGYVTDIAGLSVDSRSGQLLALSQESHLLLGLDPQLRAQSFLALLPGLNGLTQRVPQAEGLALDNAGNLYVVSERNLFFAFQREVSAP